MHIELISNAIHTYWLVIVIAACAVAGMLFAANGGFGWPYTAKPLLTNPEQVVFRRLRQAFPDLVVLAQASMARVLQQMPAMTVPVLSSPELAVLRTRDLLSASARKLEF